MTRLQSYSGFQLNVVYLICCYSYPVLPLKLSRMVLAWRVTIKKRQPRRQNMENMLKLMKKVQRDIARVTALQPKNSQR